MAVNPLEVAMTHEELVKAVTQLQDRQAILDCLNHYCRAVDRMDRELLLSAYHPDAVDDHGLFIGDREGFTNWAFDFHGTHQHSTQHIITNHTCDLQGNTAHTETYWMCAAMNRQGAPLSLVGGRYLDLFEKRNGRWAIALRKCLIDWSGDPGEVPMPPEALAAFLATGVPSRSKDDPSYQRPLHISAERLQP